MALRTALISLAFGVSAIQISAHAKAIYIDDPIPCQSSAINLNSGVPGFERAQLIEGQAAEYPPEQLRTLGEGEAYFWVEIATDGLVTSVTEIDRIGSRNFASAAVSAIKSQRYKPATINGVPTRYGKTMKYGFRLAPLGIAAPSHDYASGAFVKGFKKIENGEIDEGISILEEALAAIDRGFPMSAYEYSNFSLKLASAYWTKKDYFNAALHIQRADPQSLVKEDSGRWWRLERAISAATGEYFDILCNWPRPSYARYGEDLISDAALATIDADVQRIAAQNGPISLTPKLIARDGVGKWEHALIRRSFRFDSINGDAGDFALRCLTQTIKGKVVAGIKHTVPNNSGRCFVHVSGAPGASFTFQEDW